MPITKGKTSVALLGGSFNPIHTAHTALATYVLAQGMVDEVWFVVSPHNPLKAPQELAPFEDRLEMARLATAHDNRFRVCDIEGHLPQPSYTYRTLAHLREQYAAQGYEFWLMIGADNWNAFEQWRNTTEILTHHQLLIYPRPGYSIDPNTLLPTTHLLTPPLLELSATEIRAQISRGKIPQGLASEVWQYITDHHLYKD